MAQSAYERRFNESTKLIDDTLYRQAVETAGGAIDMLMKDLFEELKKKIGSTGATGLDQALANSANTKGNKITFGQWIHFYENERIFSKLQNALNYQFRYFNVGTLKAILEARNKCAHDDYIPMRSEAELVRNNLIVFLQETGRAPKEAAAVLPEVKTARSKGRLPSWTQIAMPNHDIRERRFDLGIFAIHLGEIAAESGSGQPEYADATSFFDLTYITRGLRTQLVQMMGRLSAKGTGASVLQLDTTFGGGKTHTLLAMYHLAKQGYLLKDREDIRALTNEARVETPPQAAVAVMDGSYLSPSSPRKTSDGLTLKTLWGEMAYQLGGVKAYEFLRSSDENLGAPGSREISEMLRSLNKPVLILIDELLDYATKAAAVKSGRGYLVEQVQSFIKALTQAVDPLPNAMVVLTLTSSPQQIFGDAARRLQEELTNQYSTFKTILERVQRTEVTAESGEIYEILRRRLFERVGSKEEQLQIADAYWQYYRANAAVFPQQVIQPGYRERLANSYPFHPDLIDLLRDRWGTIQGFQKTRGVLRLLALVVSNLYRGNHGAPLIHIGHIDLADPEIRRELLGHVDSPAGYESAIGSDIAGLPDSKAQHEDLRIGNDYYRFGLCEGLATTLFMYSHMGSSAGFVGGTKPQLWLGILQPDIIPAMAADAYGKLEAVMWYLEKEGALSRLGVDPNLNMMLVQRMDALRQDKEQIHELIYSAIEKMVGTKFGKAIIWPEDSRVVRDNNSLKLIIAPLQACYHPDDPEMRAQLYMEEILKSAGDKHRQYRNTIVFSLPNRDGVGNIENAAIRLMALQDIKTSTGHSLKDHVRDELNSNLEAAKVGLPAAVWGAYLITATAGRDDPIITPETGIKPYRQTDSLSDRIWNRLIDGERLLEKFAPDNLVRRTSGEDRFGYLWSDDQTAIKTQNLWDTFAHYDYLPMLASQQVLQDTIAWGVQRGLFGYATGNWQQPDKIYFEETVGAAQCVISEFAWLVRPEHARPLRYPPPAVIEPSVSEPVHDVFNETESKVTSRTEATATTRTVSYKGINVEIQLGALEWRQFYQSVIQPLVTQGAQVNITVNLSATHGEGFDLDFIELSLKESLNQISRNAKIDLE